MERNEHQDFIDFMGAYFTYGYGSGEEYWFPALKWFFSNLKDDKMYDHGILVKKFGGLAAWLLINTLCSASILEYGTSPRYGWLSSKGEILRDYLSDKTEDDIIEIYNTTEIQCGLTYCNCDNGKYHNENKPCKYNKLF